MTPIETAIREGRRLFDQVAEGNLTKIATLMVDHGATEAEISTFVREQWAIHRLRAIAYEAEVRSTLADTFGDGDEPISVAVEWR